MFQYVLDLQNHYKSKTQTKLLELCFLCLYNDYVYFLQYRRIAVQLATNLAQSNSLNKSPHSMRFTFGQIYNNEKYAFII